MGSGDFPGLADNLSGLVTVALVVGFFLLIRYLQRKR
jgi:hypothetical protein